MIVHQFNSEGVSAFKESNLITEFHAHPTLEIIIAKNGSFTLSTQKINLKNIQFGLIKPNIWHRLHAENCECEIIMVEPGFGVLQQILTTLDTPKNENDIIEIDLQFQSTINRETIDHWAKSPPLMNNYDKRVLQCIHFIKQNEDAKSLTLSNLASIIHLSPDRLSHLFKAQVGLPLQKYIIWSRLKTAVTFILNEQLNLTQAAHKAGFYDSAHFSRHFKEMLGISPSTVYNSRIVQDLKES